MPTAPRNVGGLSYGEWRTCASKKPLTRRQAMARVKARAKSQRGRRRPLYFYRCGYGPHYHMTRIKQEFPP